MTKPKVISSTARALANKRTTLTAKEARFVEQYLVDGNQAAAALRAGYKGRWVANTASEMMRRPAIKRAITKALQEQQARTQLTADEVLLGIKRIAAKAEKAGEFTPALRGHELIGKHLRLFSDKVELTGANDGPVEFTEIRRTIVRPTRQS